MAIYIIGNPSQPTPSAGGFYPSDPTHFVHPAAGGAGIGTISNPFTMAQAMALGQQNWRIQAEEGDYYAPNTNSNTPSWRFANQGSQAAPITIFARNPAALNTTGRSRLNLVSGSAGAGCPVISANGGHWWYGFYINEDTAWTHADTGPVTTGGQYNRYGYMRVSKGLTSWPVGLSDNNHAAFRLEGSGVRNNLIHDCWIEEYSRGGSQLSEQGIQLYGPSSGDSNAMGLITIENCYFLNNRFAVTVKSINNRLIEGGFTFRRNMIQVGNFSSEGDLQSGGIEIIELGNTLGRNQVYQNIQVGGAALCKLARHFGYGHRDIDVINNTAIALTRNADWNGFLTSSGDGGEPDCFGWRVHNNLKTGTALARMFRYDTGDAALQSMSHNLSFGALNGYWAEHPDVPAHASLRTLAQWVAAWALDRNSLTSDPQLLSQVWGNPQLAHLGPSSPARNAGVDILDLRGNGTSGIINLGAMITSDNSDQIGIRPIATS